MTNIKKRKIKHNLIGQRFGKLVAVKIAQSHMQKNGVESITMWTCKCDCGRYRNFKSSDLKSHRVKSCGCLAHIYDNDSITNTYGVTAIRRSDKKEPNGESLWLCKCSCGKLFYSRRSSIKNNHTKSCGCRRKTAHRILIPKGTIFHRLTVIKQGPDELSSGGTYYTRWYCQCTCGNITLVRGSALRNGSTKSCGCYRLDRIVESDVISHGENWISEFLMKNNIPFKSQKTFPSLKGVGHHLLSYDFMISNSSAKILIECQGEQHYRPVEWFGGESQFKKQQIHDRLKYEYAKKHNIPLIRIKYLHSTTKKQLVTDLKNQLNQLMIPSIKF